MIKCTECGYENMDGLDYCDGCGAKLAGAESAPASQAAPAAAPPAQSGAAEEPEAAPEGEAAKSPDDEAAGGQAAAAPAAEPAAPAAAPAAPAAEPAAPAAPAAEAPMVKAKLTILRGGRKGQEFPLEAGNNVVGRWDPETGSFPEVDLEADDPEAKISRKHALIRIDGNKITLEDIGSLNGTYVNRQPRLQPGNPVELKSGDELIVGKTFLKLTADPVS